MDIQPTYNKTVEFSEIDGLQNAYSVTYQFTVVSDGADFCISTHPHSKGKTETLFFKYIKADYVSAFNLLTFLCENTLGIQTCLDVLNDYSIPVLVPIHNMM